MNKQIAELAGIGPATEQNLNILGIASVEDLCFHLPYAYQNRSSITKLAEIVEGEEQIVSGHIVSIQTIYRPKK